MNYVRNLDFFDPPDYGYLHRLFMDALDRHGWHCDWVFDWNEKQVRTLISFTLSHLLMTYRLFLLFVLFELFVMHEWYFTACMLNGSRSGHLYTTAYRETRTLRTVVYNVKWHTD